MSSVDSFTASHPGRNVRVASLLRAKPKRCSPSQGDRGCTQGFPRAARRAAFREVPARDSAQGRAESKFSRGLDYVIASMDGKDEGFAGGRKASWSEIPWFGKQNVMTL
ncbi:conserved hypothetical protein [Coccidioides posadasii str. Silveira]|uniref:Uncharacterized protein n=1 Tax=Coccidioides posadasii (strain RMSCC 757 / Silveira) TaxID=443226 RepID=E9CR99_COCPS|nr:conserved hypothetical protein [Coccidioides posadasii str. Silveira]